MNAIADVQSSRDLRNLPINQVGIKDLRFPITLKTAEGTQSTVARLTMTVYLPAEQKGTHMSRFVALMEQHTEVLDFAQLHRLTAEMVALLDSRAGEISVSFPFFRKKTAPVSGIRSLLDYDVSLTGRNERRGILPQYEGHDSRNLALPVFQRNFPIWRA